MFGILDKDARQGLFFGLNSGIITTVGLIAGMSQTTSNPLYIVISVLSIAVSDGIGEGYGIYISKKAENTDNNGSGPIYSLVALFVSKVVVMLCFLLPLLFYWNIKYYKNLLWPILWSVIVLTIIDYRLATIRDEPIYNYLIPHYILLVIVLVITKSIGIILSSYV